MSLELYLLFTMLVYSGALVFVAYIFCTKEHKRYDDELKSAQKHLEELTESEKMINLEKKRVEDQAIEIFAMYEVTKELAKTINEENAFTVFKQNLAEHVSFEDCYFAEKYIPEFKQMKESPDDYVLEVENKKKIMGYLAIKKIPVEDEHKVQILSHQFALALRRIRLYHEVEMLAITDSLTNLYTRRYVLERLQEEMSRSNLRNIPLAFLMIDVDYFKNINDEYGHLSGDQVLKEIGQIIKKHIREIDIAGRYGGEEFCIVLPDTDTKGAHMAAERIRSEVENTKLKIYDNLIKVTISIGIAIFPKDALSMTELIDKSDWSLYKAKKQGRNRICAFGVYEN